MKNILVLSVFLLSCLLAGAQNGLPEFGKIEMADMQMKECAFDKNAGAMVLFNTAVVHFSIGYFNGIPYTKTERRVRIKIFNEGGFSAGSVVIPYLSRSRSSSVKDVDAIIYNLDDNGNIVAQKLDKSEIFKETLKGKQAVNSVRFTFPNLKKGSVIEYRYTKDDKDAVIAPWVYQDRIPTQLSTCKIVLSGYVTIAYKNLTPAKVSIDSVITVHARADLSQQTWNFSLQNIPALKVEPMMTSLKDNLQRSEFSINYGVHTYAGDADFKWSMYNSYLVSSRHFGLQFDKKLDGTENFIDSVLKLHGDVQKINTVYTYVKKNIGWNGEQLFLSDSLEECWQTRQGSSAEVNMLLLNLLRKVNIYAYPILVSTRENGRPELDFANLGQFNGLDVLAMDENNTPYILDCTQKGISYQTTPINVLNRQAFVVDKDKDQWINITDNRPLFNSVVEAEASIDSTGIMRGIVKSTYTGVAKAEALDEKDNADKSNDNRKATSISLIDNSFDHLQVDSTKKEFENDDNDTLIKTIQFHSTADNSGNIYFLNTGMFSMFKKNPFVDSARAADIDFGCNQKYVTRVMFSIPGNMAIDEIPKSTSIVTGDTSLEFKREFFKSDNQMVARYYFNINKALFYADEYPAIRAFFTKVYALINEQILLVKKG